MTEEIYLNCGIWEPTNTLFIAVPGFFASTAWCKSDEEYNNVLGRKFEGITADDCKSYLLERTNIKRLTKYDNIDRLLENACEDFKKMFNERFVNHGKEN